MPSGAANSQIWRNLTPRIRQHLLLLKEIKRYLTIEPVILKPLVTILNTWLPGRNYSLEEMARALDVGRQCGWLDDEPLTAMVKIHPLFAGFLHDQPTDSDHDWIIQGLTEFYSTYANYLLEQYFQSGNDELRLEGFKIVFFEFFNFERALYQSMANRQDFLHIYHLLDRTLDAEEDHPRRLYITQKLIRFAERIAFDDDLLYLQYVELRSFLADIHYRLGDFATAENIYREALDIFQSKSAHQESSMVLVNLANILSDQGRYELAIKYYKEAIELEQQHPDMGDKVESIEGALQKSWQNLGLCYYQNHQFEESRAALEQSRHYARADADEFAEAMVNFHLAQIEQRQGNRRQAAGLYTKVAEVYQRHAFDFGIAEINQQMGMLLMDSGKPEHAREAYQMALELFLSLQLPRNVAQIYNNLAHIAYETGHFAEARDYYARGLELARTHQVSQVEGLCLIGLGAVALEFDQLDHGEKYLQQAFAIFSQLDEPGSLATIAFNRAKIEQLRKRFDRALAYAEEALERYRQLDEVDNVRSAEALVATIKMAM